MRRPEQEQQIALMQWAALAMVTIPELGMLFHIPNGGGRSKVEAGILKAMGVKSGVPDLHLPLPRQGFSGLWIEMKAGKGRVSDNQNTWLVRLAEAGHMCVVARDWMSARDTILAYLGRSVRPVGSVQ